MTYTGISGIISYEEWSMDYYPGQTDRWRAVIMNKAVCCIAILVCLLMPLAQAEIEIDTSQYSIEDLVLLRSSIEDEINSRVGSATATLQPGKYVAGIDIAKGSYILVGLMDKGPDGNTPQVLYAESMDKTKEWDYVDSTYLKEGENWRITLQDGMVLEVRYGNCAIQQAAPILFAPN